MSVPASDPVRSTIRQAAIYGLKNRIIGGGTAIRYSDKGNSTVSSVGYYKTIKNVYDPPADRENMQEFPAVNVWIEGEACENAAHVQIEQNQGLLHNSFILSMAVHLNDINDPALAIDKALADIQKYFGINYYIPDSTGARTCFNCYYESSDPWGTKNTEPDCGIAIRYRVWYRQQLTNPAQYG